MINIPSPKLPPTDKKKPAEDKCIIHGGPLQGEIYQCKCGSKMCKSCAIDKKYNSLNRLCPHCSSVLFVKNEK